MLLALVLGSCADRPRDPPERAPDPATGERERVARLERQAGALRSAASTLRQVRRALPGDSMSVEWTGYLADGDLVLIHEITRVPNQGDSHQRYYFERGRLFALETEASFAPATRGTPEVGARSMRGWFYFDSTGSPLAGRMELDGRPQANIPPPPRALIEHAEHLRRQALAASRE